MFYELIRALLPHVGGLTEDAVKEVKDAIEQHQDEHEALVDDLQARTGTSVTPAPAPEPSPAPVTEGVTP